ncbi:MAG: aquaporin [Bacteroidota bacterium]
MKKYIAEFVGTFALVFCGTGAVTINEVTNGSVTNAGISVTFGLIVMTMIYALGPVSGAHFNPAVTLGFALNKNFLWKEVLSYTVAQIVGAFAASFVLKFLFPASIFLGATIPAGSALQSFVLEIILAFFLMLVILLVTTGAKEQGMFAGLAIGGVVLLEAMFAGPVSGASMNPVRSLTPAIVSGQIQHLWLYLIAPFLGVTIAIIFHQIIRK